MRPPSLRNQQIHVLKPEKQHTDTSDVSTQLEKQPTPRRMSRLPIVQNTGLGVSSPPPPAAASPAVAAARTNTTSPLSHKSKRSVDSLRSSTGEASFGEHGITFGAGGKGLVAEGVVSKEIGAAQTLKALDADGNASDSSKKRKAKQQTSRRY
ncbi:hypothetical protein KCU67_g13769, partial [Aureobasidium melanogenum]